MITDFLPIAMEIISAAATVALLLSIWTACRSYGVQYLVAVPVGFGLMALSFLLTVIAWVNATRSTENLSLEAFYLLIQTYGLIFLAFTYARRTRLRLVGESFTLELLLAGSVATVVFVMIFASASFVLSNLVPIVPDLFLRLVMFACSIYLVYETSRNWSLTRRAADGFVTIAYSFLVLEQVGFMSTFLSGSIGLFLGYEGRMLGLFALIALVHVGIKKGDFATTIKRLGLLAPAH